jgi:hypothetical protein
MYVPGHQVHNYSSNNGQKGGKMIDHWPIKCVEMLVNSGRLLLKIAKLKSVYILSTILRVGFGYRL